MYSKVLIVFAVVTLSSANDIFEAVNILDYERVFDNHFEASWAITQQSRDVFVNASNKIISKIQVTDLREGKDGIARIISGGLGHHNVTISLKSPGAFRGYEFLIEVFGFDYDPMDNVNVESGQRGEPKPEIPQGPRKEDTITNVPAHATTAPTNRLHFPRNRWPTQDHTMKPERTTSTEKAVPKEDIEIPEHDEQYTKQT